MEGRQGHSGTCDEHGGASVVPQAPSANDVDSAGGTEDRRRAETAATEQNPAGTDNSADGVGSGECGGAESAASRLVTPNRGNRRHEPARCDANSVGDAIRWWNRLERTTSRTDHGLDGHVCHSTELNSRATRTRGLLCEYDDSQVFAQTHEGYPIWFYMTMPRLRARAMEITVGGDCGPRVGNSQMKRGEEQ